MGMGIKSGINMPSMVTLDKRGRIVVPKEIRKKLDLAEGSALLLEPEGEETLILRAIRRSVGFVNDPLWLAVHNPAKSRVPLTRERLERWEEELWAR